MSKYAAEHASARAEVKAAGSPVTFTLTAPGTYDAATGVWGTPTTTTVPGYAIRTKGDPLKYQALGLVQSESPMLLFVPDTYGGAPAPGYSCAWNSMTYIVRDVDPLAPDGLTIKANVVMTR